MKRKSYPKGKLSSEQVELYYKYQKALLESLSKSGFMSEQQCEDCITEIMGCIKESVSKN